jgi:hypothetical protein
VSSPLYIAITAAAGSNLSAKLARNDYTRKPAVKSVANSRCDERNVESGNMQIDNARVCDNALLAGQVAAIYKQEREIRNRDIKRERRPVWAGVLTL